MAHIAAAHTFLTVQENSMMKNRVFATILLIVLLTGLSASPVHARTSDYTITDFGTLGGSSSFPSAINNRGQVVGYSFPPAIATHAFLWEDGTMIDLGTLTQGSYYSQAVDINDHGQVAGYSATAS